ncbi:MAG: hypothetical protein LWY06_12425 [Firmicutes bacterium]|nr:hypothetical protein [Bacillota bacterium]
MTDRNANIQITREWNRPDPLKVEGKNPEKAYRWVDKGRLEQREREGWSRVDSDSVKHNNPDGSSAGAPQYRELVLCEMPREQAQSRNRYFQEKAKQAMEAAARQFHQNGRRLGIPTDV